jgi:hypothetical protein
MSKADPKPVKRPPEISPYLLTVILAGLGLWCTWDGWFTSNPEMQKYLWFNRITGAVLSAWAIVDYKRMRKKLALVAKKDGAGPSGGPQEGGGG